MLPERTNYLKFLLGFFWAPPKMTIGNQMADAPKRQTSQF